MAENPLLEEFAVTNPGVLQRRLADAFDKQLTASDDDAIEALLTELTNVVMETIDALDRD